MVPELSNGDSAVHWRSPAGAPPQASSSATSRLLRRYLPLLPPPLAALHHTHRAQRHKGIKITNKIEGNQIRKLLAQDNPRWAGVGRTCGERQRRGDNVDGRGQRGSHPGHGISAARRVSERGDARRAEGARIPLAPARAHLLCSAAPPSTARTSCVVRPAKRRRIWEGSGRWSWDEEDTESCGYVCGNDLARVSSGRSVSCWLYIIMEPLLAVPLANQRPETLRAEQAFFYEKAKQTFDIGLQTIPLLYFFFLSNEVSC